MGSTSLFLPCAAAPNAPRPIMPSRCYELKGWHCGHGGHGGNFSWLCWGFSRKQWSWFCFPWKVFCIPCLPNLPPKNVSFGTLLFLLLRPFRYPQLSFETCCVMPTLLTVASWSYAYQLVHFQFVQNHRPRNWRISIEWFVPGQRPQNYYCMSLCTNRRRASCSQKQSVGTLWRRQREENPTPQAVSLRGHDLEGVATPRRW